MDKSSKRGWDKCMETPTKHEQFRVIICAFRKYTTLSAGTASVSGQQTVFDGTSKCSPSPVSGRDVLSLWSVLLFPQESSYIFYTFVINIRLLCLSFCCVPVSYINTRSIVLFNNFCTTTTNIFVF